MKTFISYFTLLALFSGIWGIAQVPEQQKMMEAMQAQMAGGMSTNSVVPLTNEQLKQWLPESLLGMERIEVNMGTMGAAGIASIEGRYNTTNEPEFLSTSSGGDRLNPNNKTCIVGVMDGAGGSGSSMLMAKQMMSGMGFESEDENKQHKTVEILGIQAQQVYYKRTNKTELEFVYDERFMVSVAATNRNPEETMQLVNELGLERLLEMKE